MQYKEIEQKESIKQLAERQKQRAGQVQPIQQFPQKSSKKILIILIILIIVIIAIVVLWLVLREKTNWGNSGGNGGGGGTTLKGTFEEKLKTCLEKEDFSIECNKLFVGSDVYKECEKLENLRDKCLYKIATGGRFDLCESIEDTQLKNKCGEEMLKFPITQNE